MANSQSLTYGRLVSDDITISALRYPAPALLLCCYLSSTRTSGHPARSRMPQTVGRRPQTNFSIQSGPTYRVKSSRRDHLSWAHRSGLHLNNDWGVRMSSAQLYCYFLTCSARYEFYSSFAIWPGEVRSDLRAGVKAKQQGNLALSRKLLIQCVFHGMTPQSSLIRG